MRASGSGARASRFRASVYAAWHTRTRRRAFPPRSAAAKIAALKNPNRDEKLKPSRLSARDRKALQAFLESLTGTPTYTKAPDLP